VTVNRLTTLLRAAGLALGFIVYVWVAAVHYAEEVRRRKAARRRR
jgi:hypothetical protein